MASRECSRRKKLSLAASTHNFGRRRSRPHNSVCSQSCALGYTRTHMAGYKKILVLLDMSDASEQITVAGRDMAAHSNAAIVLLHVVEFVPTEPMGETMMPTVQVEEDLARRSLVKLNEMSARL